MIANENNATEQNSMSANENNVTEPNNMNDNENNTTEQNNDSKIEQSKSIRKALFEFLGALATVGTVVYGVTHFINSVNNNYAVI